MKNIAFCFYGKTRIPESINKFYKKIEKTVHYQKIAVVCVSFFNSIRGPGPERVEFWEFG